MRFPLIVPISTNVFLNTFLIDAICVALIATIGIEIRQLLVDKKNKIYSYFNSLLYGKDLTEIQIVSITFVVTFLSAFSVYLLAYLLFGLGTGMLGVKGSKINKFKFFEF